MRVLLDTHTLIWAVSDPTRLGSAAVAALNEPTNELLTSAQAPSGKSRSKSD
jgi:PIN domain nuclease of toxin-antitoxin system